MPFVALRDFRTLALAPTTDSTLAYARACDLYPRTPPRQAFKSGLNQFKVSVENTETSAQAVWNLAGAFEKHRLFGSLWYSPNCLAPATPDRGPNFLTPKPVRGAKLSRLGVPLHSTTECSKNSSIHFEPDSLAKSSNGRSSSCTVNLFWRIATEIYSLGEFQSLLHHSAR